jgi:hypothetical protein
MFEAGAAGLISRCRWVVSMQAAAEGPDPHGDPALEHPVWGCGLLYRFLTTLNLQPFEASLPASSSASILTV